MEPLDRAVVRVGRTQTQPKKAPAEVRWIDFVREQAALILDHLAKPNPDPRFVQIHAQVLSQFCEFTAERQNDSETD